MTKEEFLGLQQHDRIKFTGKVAPKNRYTAEIITIGKTYTITNVIDYSSSRWGDYKGISVSFYGKGSYPVENPDDWEVVAHRHDRVVAVTSNKRAISNSRITLAKCKTALNESITRSRSNFDYYLNRANLSSKLEFLRNLSPAEKRLAEFLFEFKDVDTFLCSWEKGKDASE